MTCVIELSVFPGDMWWTGKGWSASYLDALAFPTYAAATAYVNTHGIAEEAVIRCCDDAR